jgi:hypothetical protein
MIIKCDNLKDYTDVQKELFRISYRWCYGNCILCSDYFTNGINSYITDGKEKTFFTSNYDISVRLYPYYKVFTARQFLLMSHKKGVIPMKGVIMNKAILNSFEKTSDAMLVNKYYSESVPNNKFGEVVLKMGGGERLLALANEREEKEKADK